FASCFFFSSRRRHTRFSRDWSSDVCSSDLLRRKTAGTAVISLSYGALIVPVMNTDRLLGRPLLRRQIMPRLNRLITSISLMAGSLLAPVTLMADVDSDLKDYVRAAGVSGNLSSIGSDTLNNLMTLWAEEFARFYPNVNIQIQGAGSSTAPPALTEGTATLA